MFKLLSSQANYVMHPVDSTLKHYVAGPINTANASGGPEALCDPPRHLGRNNIVFADGHVTAVTSEEAKDLLWNPSEK
jgi:prepilin-type processing-associated H-X9-DG protein